MRPVSETEAVSTGSPASAGDPVSTRTTIRRYAHRAHYDRASVTAILDAGVVCHVGVQTEAGHPVVIPLAYGREGDVVYLHGSAASRLFRTGRADGVEMCMTVTMVDGLVLARSTYNHDINYRSVVILGKATEVRDLEEKRRGLDVLVEHIVPGRTVDAREPTEKELRATMLLKLPIDESSAKVRTGWPEDTAADYDLPIWAGVVPLDVVARPPLRDPALRFTLPVPEYATTVARFAR